MIKVNELRFNNFVTGGTILAIKEKCAVVNYGDRCSNTDYEYIEPIEITDEWLINFGFKPDEYFTWTDSKEELFKIQKNFDNPGYSHVWDGSFTGSPCKYVHQLQNLYFSLTGEELQKNH